MKNTQSRRLFRSAEHNKANYFTWKSVEKMTFGEKVSMKWNEKTESKAEETAQTQAQRPKSVDHALGNRKRCYD